MLKSGITMQLYAGNLTRGRMLVSAGDKAGGQLFTDLISKQLDEDLRKGVQWKSAAMGALAHAFGEYMVEIVRFSNLVVWGSEPGPIKNHLNVVTGSLSYAIMTEVTPLQKTSGRISKMSADITITYKNILRQEQSNMLRGMTSESVSGFPIIEGEERISEYTPQTLDFMFSLPDTRMDAQELWMAMLQDQITPSLASAFLSFPDYIKPTSPASFMDVITSIQQTAATLRLRNDTVVEQSAVARMQFYTENQAQRQKRKRN